MGPLCNSVLFRFLGRIRYCRIGKKVESQRALRPSWGPKGPLSPRQMCTQKEWKTRLSDVKQWKRLQTSVISAKRHNNSFQPLSLWSLLFSHNTTLYHHFWRSYLATCPLVNPNGITGKRVTMVTSCGCGYTCSDSFFPPFTFPQCPLLIQQPLLFLLSSTTALPRLHRAINHSQSTLRMD